MRPAEERPGSVNRRSEAASRRPTHPPTHRDREASVREPALSLNWSSSDLSLSSSSASCDWRKPHGDQLWVFGGGGWSIGASCLPFHGGTLRTVSCNRPSPGSAGSAGGRREEQSQRGSAEGGWTGLSSFDLLFQSGHPLLQVELEALVGLGEEPVHRVRQPLVVLFVHLLPLSSLRD